MAQFNKIGFRAVGRLICGVTVSMAGLLVVVPHENSVMWQLSLLLSEWGHWLGLLSVLLLVRWRQSWVHATAATLTAAGIAMLFSPLTSAYRTTQALTSTLDDAFGTPISTSSTNAQPRPRPIVLADLFFGVSTEDVLVDEHVFAVRGGENLTLDLYRPLVGLEPRPVVIVIHGGGWTAGSKRELPKLNRYLAARGYVVASIDYRLSPRWRFPVPQEDLRDAIDYVKTLETTHNVDPDRFALLGRSAGGQIALLEGYLSTDPSIRGVISLYGPTAMRWGYLYPAKRHVVDSTARLIDYLGGPPSTHGAQYDAAEPARFVTQQSPPTLFIQGLRDEHVVPFHVDHVSARLIDHSVPHVIVRMPWATHGCDYVFSGPCGQISTFAIERFLGAILRAPSNSQTKNSPTTGKVLVE